MRNIVIDKFMKIFSIILFFTVLCVKLEAQKADSTTQSDSYQVIKLWSFENAWNGMQNQQADTQITSYQNYLPLRNNFIANLGNSGSATFPLTYSNSNEEYPLFYKSLKVYYSSDRHVFYNTHKPYTRINFAAGASKDKGEQYINILHTQNVNKYLNFSFRANGHNSTGYYLKQENRNNSFRLSTNYLRNKYKLQAYFNIEKFRLVENGGVQNDSYVIDSLYKPENLNVRLNNAKNTVVFREGFLHQIISLTGKTDSTDTANIKYNSIFEIQSTTRYQWFKKLYTDIPYGYYSDIYVDSAATKDSTQSETLFQNLSLVLTENNPLKTAFLLGLNYDQRNYYYYYSDTLLKSYGIQASVYKTNGKRVNGYFTIEQWLNGYLKSNNKFEGKILYQFQHFRDTLLFVLNTGYFTKNVAYYENHYYSNNFKWNNNFVNSAFSFSTFSFNDKLYNAGFSANFYTVKNYVYFDTLTLPKQQNHTIKIKSATLYKNFKLGHFHFNNRAVFQQSSNDSILPLPLFVGVHSFFYQFLIFKKVLHVQFGTEVFYFTKYFAPEYVPATCQFALQNERQTGGYPYVDVFLNFNWKRARIFFKIEHVNYSLMAANYFTAPHYPQTPRILKFGISWNFYD